MGPRLLKTDVAQFSSADWTGANTSGFRPLSDRVIVLPDTVNAKTSGGVELPEDLQGRMKLAAESGIIVAIGPEAFRYTVDGRAWVSERPEIGYTVYFERYAGQILHGRDGRTYRLMDTKCVGAIATEQTEAQPCQA